jgi:hypothetical protein
VASDLNLPIPGLLPSYDYRGIPPCPAYTQLLQITLEREKENITPNLKVGNTLEQAFPKGGQ